MPILTRPAGRFGGLSLWEMALRGLGVVGILLAAGVATAAAQDMRPPNITRIAVDWAPVGADLDKIDLLKIADTAADPKDHVSSSMARLNGATLKYFPAIAASPVPVLLPLDTAALLRDIALDKAGTTISDYTNGFVATPFFQSGPGGYDAVFAPSAIEPPEHNIMISGSALLYELDEPTGMITWPADHDLEAEFPGIRRVFLENYARYIFVRYGVPYVVSMECFDGGARGRRMSCRDADKVLVHFLKSLHLAGGTPRDNVVPIEPNTIDRPQAESGVFTYYAPGHILPGTGSRGNGGRNDDTVYSRIRFPFADAPAFANSQAFMNYGSCDATGRLSAGTVGGVAAYRCRVNGSQTLVWNEAAADNYSYPWRDNFCEHRWFYVGQCPGGVGHQGQDIRPASCKQRENANRCQPYQHDVVAVRDGMLLRFPGQMAVYLVVNAQNERVRFRYLHMFPKFLDQDGVLAGRVVKEGDVLGKAGTYERRENATTYHLHFDMQVPTRYGWVFVNPYMTLVAAYERQIRGRGREIKDEVVTGSLGAPAKTTAVEGSANEPVAVHPPPGVPEVKPAAKPNQSDVDSDDDDDD